VDFVVKVYRYSTNTTSLMTATFYMHSWTGRVKDLIVSTKNPGGFSECTFRVDMPFADALDIYENYHHHFMSVESGGGETVWRGRIEDITAEPGQVTIIAFGMWSSLFDSMYDDGSVVLVPITENSISFRTGFTPIDSQYQQYAQSFMLSEERAIQDIQLNLANFGSGGGKIVVELCENGASIPGAVIAYKEVDVKSLEAGGFSEYTGVTTDYRLSANTTYWVVVRGDADYYGYESSMSGTDDSAIDNKSYLVDTTADFLAGGVAIGTLVRNTTDGCEGTVSSIELHTTDVPDQKCYYRDFNTFTETPVVVDNNTGTYQTYSNFVFTEDYIYIGNSTKFGGIDVTIGPNAQTSPAALIVQYGNGSSWTRLNIISDGTMLGNSSLGKSGVVQWVSPTSWAEDDVQEVDAYWVRLSFSSDVSTLFSIAEVRTGTNTKLDFEALTGGTDNDFDSGDAYRVSISSGIGIDKNANYSSGKLMYNSDGSWSDYSPASDMIFAIWSQTKFYFGVGDSVTASDVIEDAINTSLFIRHDTAFFKDEGRIVNPIKFNTGEKSGNVIEKVLSFGSSGETPEPLFFGIYDEEYAILRKMTDGTRWYIDAKSLPSGQQALALSSSLSGLKTRTAVLYSDTVGSRSITPWIINDELYRRFGYHRDGIYSIAGATDITAEILSEIVAEAYSKPAPTLTILVEGFVLDSAGKKQPAWKVRAGDIVKFKNLIPTSTTLDSDTVDNISTLYVQETAYDAETGRLSIVPTNKTTSLLDILLAMSGLSGGSMI